VLPKGLVARACWCALGAEPWVYPCANNDIGKVDPLLNREVHHIGKKRITNKELHLNAQIGEYDIDYVVLNLGSEINVMTKKTWALMGKLKMVYSPISLHMTNQQVVSPFG
jgi:hypothetical protein